MSVQARTHPRFEKGTDMVYFIIAAVEIVALAIGTLLYHYGFAAWYVIPLSLLAPAFIAAIVVLIGLAFALANSDGGNPFQ